MIKFSDEFVCSEQSMLEVKLDLYFIIQKQRKQRYTGYSNNIVIKQRQISMYHVVFIFLSGIILAYLSCGQETLVDLKILNLCLIQVRNIPLG